MTSSFPFPSDPAADKASARLAARAHRAHLAQAAEPGAAEAAAAHFLTAIPRRPGATVALYWPLPSEFDARPLLRRLAELGHTCALPVVDAPGRPLRFRIWHPDMALRPGPLGVLQPGPEAPECCPDIVVMACLAFDRAGYRLGYGAGYYDRTLAALRGAGGRPLTAVVLAFAGQAVARVPRAAHDQPADWIVTEDFVIPSERDI